MSEFAPQPGPEPTNMEPRPLPNEPHAGRPAADKAAARISRLHPPETKKRVGSFTPEQRQYLLLYSRGIPRREIWAHMDSDYRDKKDRAMVAGIKNAVGTSSMLTVVLTTIDRGDFSREEILEGFNRKDYLKLNETDREALAQVIIKNGRGFSQNKAAEVLAITPKAYSSRLDTARNKLGATTQEQAAALFLVENPLTAHEIDILGHRASGATQRKIARYTQYTTQQITEQGMAINKKLGTNSILHSILTYIEEGKIPPTKLLKTIDTSRFEELQVDDITLLDTLIENRGAVSNYRDIGEKLGRSEDQIGRSMSRIAAILGTRSKEHTAAVYFALKQSPTEPAVQYDKPAKRELGQTDREILLLKAKGLTNKQIANEIEEYTEAMVMNHVTAIYTLLEASTATQAIGNALEIGVITPTEILGDRGMTAVDALDNREVQVLNAMFLPSSGGTNNELVAATSYTLKQVKNVLASVKRKLGTNNRFHSASFYAAAKKLQEQH